jgi:hypothetical protein
MNLSSKNLAVVNIDGCWFGVDSAYLVDLSLFDHLLAESFREGLDSERIEIALSKGQSLAWTLKQGEPKFISKNLMYEIEGWVYDDSKPAYRYLVPLYSGRYHMVDCWIVNEKGQIHPGYNCAGVALGTERFKVVDDSPLIQD